MALGSKRRISVRSVSTEQAVMLREAMNTYLRLYAPADEQTQETCELFIGKIDEQLRGDESSGTDATITLSPTSALTSADGGSQSFDVTLAGEGSWSVSAADMWLHIDSPTGPQAESGAVNYTADWNDEGPRSGEIHVNDAVFTVTQEIYPVPAVSITPKGVIVPIVGASGSIAVTITAPGTSGTWTVDKDASATWLTYSPTTPQSADGTVSWTAEANPDPARTANFYINGKTFTVDQNGVPA
jgi:hypothetical protein